MLLFGLVVALIFLILVLIVFILDHSSRLGRSLAAGFLGRGSGDIALLSTLALRGRGGNGGVGLLLGVGSHELSANLVVFFPKIEKQS